MIVTIWTPSSINLNNPSYKTLNQMKGKKMQFHLMIESWKIKNNPSSLKEVDCHRSCRAGNYLIRPMIMTRMELEHLIPSSRSRLKMMRKKTLPILKCKTCRRMAIKSQQLTEVKRISNPNVKAAQGQLTSIGRRILLICVPMLMKRIRDLANLERCSLFGTMGKINQE